MKPATLFISAIRTFTIVLFLCLAQLNASALIGINDAPVLDNIPALGFSTLAGSGAPAGAAGMPVGTFTGGVFDQDDNEGEGPALKGIAITAADITNGSWYYSINNGSTWFLLGSVSSSNARLLADNGSTRIYFQPNTGFTGIVSTGITFRAWDQTSGTNGAIASTTSNGGTTAFSVATDVVSVTVNPAPVNNAPILDPTKSPALNPINEDASAPVGAVGTLVSNLIDNAVPAGGLDNVTDVDAGALTGIAIIASDAVNGTGYYSLNGGISWSPVGAVSPSAALLLANNINTRLYFQPAANINGTLNSVFTFRAWDQTTGTEGGLTSTTANGGSTAFSVASDGISVTLTAVNDAPVATNLSASETYTEDVPLNLVDIVAADVDNATITATLTLSDVSAGSLSTATSGAVTSTFSSGIWIASGLIADVNTLLSGVIFTPATGYYSNFTVVTSVSDGIAAPLTGVKLFTGIHVVDDADGDGYTPEDGDCDDTDAAVHPFAVELCNGVDDDCDGTVDNNAVDAALWFLDFDSDGFGDAAVSVSSCSQPSGYSSNNTDCDDANSSTWHSDVLFLDSDMDGYTNGTATVCYGAAIPAGYSLTSLGTDCNDNDNTTHNAPAAPSDISGPAGACAGQNNVVFSVAPVQDATSYVWTLPAGATGNSTSNTISVNFSTTFSGGTICVSAVNSCASANVCRTVVHYNVKPVKPSAISGANKVCPNSSEVYSIASVANATYYQWTAPANGVIISGQGTTTVTVSYNNAFTSGSLQVSASNCVGTSAAQKRTISLKNAPAKPSAISGAGKACRNSQEVYSINPVSGALSYQWTAPSNATIIAGQGTTSVTVEFGAAFSGGTLSVYSVGCAGNSNSRNKNISRRTSGCGSGKTDETEPVSDLDSQTQLKENSFDAVAYPNPFGNEFTLKLTGNSTPETEIRIVNTMGQLVQELHEKSSSSELKLGADLPEGMYFIFLNRNNHIKTLRVIKTQR